MTNFEKPSNPRKQELNNPSLDSQIKGSIERLFDFETSRAEEEGLLNELSTKLINNPSLIQPALDYFLEVGRTDTEAEEGLIRALGWRMVSKFTNTSIDLHDGRNL